MDQGGNYWTLFTPGIWKVLHAVLHSAPAAHGLAAAEVRAVAATLGPLPPVAKYFDEYWECERYFDPLAPERVIFKQFILYRIKKMRSPQ
jgi:hypothetical protein